VRQASTAPATRRHRERGWRAKLFRDARRRDDGDRWAIQPRRDTGTSAFFRGQNVNWGQRSPIMRIFLFLLFFVFIFQCTVKYSSTPTSKLHYPDFFLGYAGRFIRPIV